MDWAQIIVEGFRLKTGCYGMANAGDGGQHHSVPYATVRPLSNVTSNKNINVTWESLKKSNMLTEDLVSQPSNMFARGNRIHVDPH